MSREYKSVIRIVAAAVLDMGGFTLAMLSLKIQGWPAVVLSAIAVWAVGYAAALFIEEGRARERANQEPRPPGQQ